MGNIATRTEHFGGGDYRGLASARGTEHPKSGTAALATFTPEDDYPDGYLPALLPVSYNEGTGLYEQIADTDSASDLAGFVAHNVSIVAGANPTIAVLTDATIIAEFIPGDHDLVDGRYQTDLADDTGS